MGTAAQDAAASTIVLVGDVELELRVAPPVLTFARWGVERSSRAPVPLTISLRSREDADPTFSGSSSTVCVPLVITPPLTARFRLSTDGDGNDLLPLLDVASRRSTTLLVAFVPPSPTESDDLWDNFHDQLVIQSRLSRLTHSTQQSVCDGNMAPESRSDPPQTTTIEAFHEVVSSAKSSVALAMQRAKAELAVPVAKAVEPTARPPSASTGAAERARVQPRRLVKPPATLPTIGHPKCDSKGNQDQPTLPSDIGCSGPQGRSKANREAMVKPERRTLVPLRPQQELQSKAPNGPERRGTRQTNAATRRAPSTQQPKAVDDYDDDALKGFEDSEPEVDDAPLVPDDLAGTMRSLEEDDGGVFVL
ncbi:hypothetical protein P43SY_003762 [Pythium insidiosum]|uniref:Uncharacterized protein n=1 Tax=Pythium insidiosum TaxID=114742 RepID=A0AAD5Q3P1_PYTIN|nr:hypothetical protein P43SY_003762 [Pythium insidiosum]